MGQYISQSCVDLIFSPCGNTTEIGLVLRRLFLIGALMNKKWLVVLESKMTNDSVDLGVFSLHCWISYL